MAGTYYRHGDFNVICDRTGFKVKASDTRIEWNGLRVRKESYEPRHPQDFVRGRRDDQSVDNPRSEATDGFAGVNEALNFHTDPDASTVSVSAAADGGNTGDGTIDGLTADLSASIGGYTLKVTRVTRAAADNQDPGDNGEFRLTDPDSDFVGTGEVGVQFTGGGLCFTLNEDGSTAFAVGDLFTITVS